MTMGEDHADDDGQRARRAGGRRVRASADRRQHRAEAEAQRHRAGYCGEGEDPAWDRRAALQRDSPTDHRAAAAASECSMLRLLAHRNHDWSAPTRAASIPMGVSSDLFSG